MYRFAIVATLLLAACEDTYVPPADGPCLDQPPTEDGGYACMQGIPDGYVQGLADCEAGKDYRFPTVHEGQEARYAGWEWGYAAGWDAADCM